ncbi:MAG TPA: NIL domain-containing protein [Chthonomonadaceae bacterium]|nr:NIL domain-containing protein [Chthonomonadaceae bacterium]
MPAVDCELHARRDAIQRPILWRLVKMFNVVTNVRRARLTEDYGYVQLRIEGSTREVEQAQAYLESKGLIKDARDPAPSAARPEEAVPQPNTITVRLSTANPEQGHAPVIYRICKDFNVVVNLQRAAFDEEEGGWLEVEISGQLLDVQRAIAYLHTTGIHVDPRQRSVADYMNL